MRKVGSYILFLAASLMVIYLFVTATTYLQLAVAVILYPVIAYFAVKLFFRKPKKVQAAVAQVTPPATVKQVVVTQPQEGVDDDDKRTFLKLVGATGVFFFVSSLLGRRADNLFFGKALDSGTSPTGSPSDAGPGTGSPAANGYNISEIDDGTITYYGFTNKAGAWLIMREDTDTTSFRYAKGNIDFPATWANRTNLKYDYYYNLF